MTENLAFNSQALVVTSDSSNPFATIRIRTLIVWNLVATLVCSVILTFVMAIQQTPKLPEDSWAYHPISLLTLYFGSVIFQSIWIYYQSRQHSLSIKKLFGNIHINYDWLYILGVVYLGSLFISAWHLSLIGLSTLFPDYVSSRINQSDILLSTEAPHTWLYDVFQFFASFIIAPVLEEVVFRGIILHRWAQKWGVGMGLAASSLFFGILHIDKLIPSGFLGLILGIVYLKTQNLMIPIICHALLNLLSVISAVLQPDSSGIFSLARLHDYTGYIIGHCLLAIVFLSIFLIQNRQHISSAKLPYYWKTTSKE